MLRCRLAKIDAERCESGRIDMLGKHASQQWDRGFESHPLRQARFVRLFSWFILVGVEELERLNKPDER
jgi:hypothetical protein